MVSALKELRVTVGGERFGGWKRARVSRSLEAVSGAWELEVSGARRAWPIGVGARVKLHLGPYPLAVGFVDEVLGEFDAGEHRVSVRGRDAAADLVDCSALNEPGQWHGATLGQIVTELAGPYGVQVHAPFVSDIPIDEFSLQTGESVWEAIERLCRRSSVLASSDPVGGISLSRFWFAPAAAPLVEGVNVVSARLSCSHAERYRRYVVKGQQSGPDYGLSEAAAPGVGVAWDAGARKGRVLLLMAEGPIDAARSEERARWEAAVRAARAEALEVVVVGWRQAEGAAPWVPGLLVQVKLPTLRLEAELVVRDVTLEAGLDDGARATLTLARAGAFDPQPVVPEESGLSETWGLDELGDGEDLPEDFE